MFLYQFEKAWRFRTRQCNDRGIEFGEKNAGRGKTDPSSVLSVIHEDEQVVNG
jgi:hypothetical protein